MGLEFGAGDQTSGTRDPFNFSLIHHVSQLSHFYCLHIEYISSFREIIVIRETLPQHL